MPANNQKVKVKDKQGITRFGIVKEQDENVVLLKMNPSRKSIFKESLEVYGKNNFDTAHKAFNKYLALFIKRKEYLAKFEAVNKELARMVKMKYPNENTSYYLDDKFCKNRSVNKVKLKYNKLLSILKNYHSLCNKSKKQFINTYGVETFEKMENKNRHIMKG